MVQRVDGQHRECHRPLGAGQYEAPIYGGSCRGDHWVSVRVIYIYIYIYIYISIYIYIGGAGH